MIVLENVSKPDGQTYTIELESASNELIDASGLIAIPAGIDPHVHFRTPGLSYKEDWQTGALAAIKGGMTTVFDMPNTLPPTITEALIKEKKELINQQLLAAKLPLHYQLFFGADKNHLDQIPLVKNQVVGIKVFMGCSTGNLVIDDDESLEAVFAIAAKEQLLVAVHAEDEQLIKAQKQAYPNAKNYSDHSLIRNEAVAVRAVEKAITLAKRYNTRLYILHVSCEDEIDLIRQAKKHSLPVFAETTPHHLFFDDSYYATLKGKAVVNPPLRSQSHKAALWRAIQDQTIDTIGSDHAPHTEAEKNLPYPQCPSGMPGIEFVLPLLLNACHQGKLDLNRVISLTSARARNIFSLAATTDKVLIDLKKKKTVQQTVSKCAWTPYANLELQGWPVYTILGQQLFII